VIPRSRSRVVGGPSAQVERPHRHGRCPTAATGQSTRSWVSRWSTLGKDRGYCESVARLAWGAHNSGRSIDHLISAGARFRFQTALRVRLIPRSASANGHRLTLVVALREESGLKLKTVGVLRSTEKGRVRSKSGLQVSVPAGLPSPRSPHKARVCSEKLQGGAPPWPALKRSDCALISPQRKMAFCNSTSRKGTQQPADQRRRRSGIALIAAGDSAASTANRSPGAT